MQTIISKIHFKVQLSAKEIAAIARILCGNRVKFEVFADADLAVKVSVEVEDAKATEDQSAVPQSSGVPSRAGRTLGDASVVEKVS